MLREGKAAELIKRGRKQGNKLSSYSPVIPPVIIVHTLQSLGEASRYSLARDWCRTDIKQSLQHSHTVTDKLIYTLQRWHMATAGHAPAKSVRPRKKDAGREE